MSKNAELIKAIEKGCVAAERAEAVLDAVIDRLFTSANPDADYFAGEYQRHESLIFQADDQLLSAIEYMKTALDMTSINLSPTKEAIVRMMDDADDRQMSLIYSFVRAISGKIVLRNGGVVDPREADSK